MNDIFSSTEITISLNVVVAFIIGGMIGYNRVKNNRPAGIRTQALICAGSALLSGLSIALGLRYSDIGSDPTRLIAQIVSGIGFIGGGVILRNKGRVKGVTTASTIWFTASLGIAVGAGYYLLAFVGYLLFVMTGIIAKIEYSTGIKSKPFSITYPKKREKDVESVLGELSIQKVSSSDEGSMRTVVVNSSNQRNDLISQQLDKKGVEHQFKRLSSIEEY